MSCGCSNQPVTGRCRNIVLVTNFLLLAGAYLPVLLEDGSQLLAEDDTAILMEPLEPGHLLLEGQDGALVLGFDRSGSTRGFEFQREEQS